MRCLIVEDERDLNDVLFDYLEDSYPDMMIEQVFDGYDALTAIKSTDYDIILLDVMLPHVDGFDIVRELRKLSNTPVIMLSALSDEDNQIRGYDLGIDEFVAKPYSPKLVMKKVAAVLQRHRQEDSTSSTFGIITYHISNHQITVEDKAVDLNKKEWDLFTLFVTHPNRLFSRDDLLNRVWGYDYFGDARTVDTHIKRLRKKLGPASTYIKTVFKEGYKFEL
jgi:two-component system response regulator VanR